MHLQLFRDSWKTVKQICTLTDASYISIILSFFMNHQEHVHRLKGLLDKLPLSGLKLKPSKCDLFFTKLHYLGYVVSQSRIEADPKKIAAIADLPIPNCN